MRFANKQSTENIVGKGECAGNCKVQKRRMHEIFVHVLKLLRQPSESRIQISQNCVFFFNVYIIITLPLGEEETV